VSESFVHEQKVRFDDVDHAGIVYYPRFFHYCHVAFEELFEVIGVKFVDMLDGEHVGFPAVKVEGEYKSPVRFGDVLRVSVTCARLGDRSVTLRYRMERIKDGVLCMDARVTGACVDMRTFTSQEIPAKYRELFSRFSEA
jgi:4-hydroxybenzoyl-CoA thioesterase